MDTLHEIETARQMVVDGKLTLDDFLSLIIGLFAPRRRVDYYDYIQSPAWQTKAEAAKKRVGYRCQICNAGREDGAILDAHHRTYERLGNERPEDITVLCRNCHELYETNKRAF